VANLSTQSKQVGDLFRQAKPLTVPRFQRDFSWEKDMVDQLWEDTWQSMNGSASSYFLGSIVLKSTPEMAVAEVIDGQQRLTCLSLLVCALRDALREVGSDTAKLAAARLEMFYLAEDGGDITSTFNAPKLTPNETNRKFYEEKILNNPDISVIKENARARRVQKSNRLMAQAYLNFRDNIQGLVGTGKSVETIADTIKKAMDSKLQIIEITVADDYDAYLLFETLNDRGLALSVADLLKNYLFSKAENRLPDIQDNWQKMIGFLQSAETKKFLRHYWLSQYGIVRDKDLYKSIKDKYRDKSSILGLSKELRDEAEFYGAFNDPQGDIWTIFDAVKRRTIIRGLEDLKTFGVNQYYPLLLSTVIANPDMLPAIIGTTVNFAFRYSIIGAGGTGNIEKAVSDAAIYVRNKKSASTAVGAFEYLAHLYPTDDEFMQNFAEKKLSQANLARYALRKINDFRQDNGMIVDDDAFEVNLEHILPQGYDEKTWSGFADGEDLDYDEYVYRLGNMTLIKSEINRKASNLSFEKKKEEYLSIEPLRVSDYIIKQDSWNFRCVEENQQQLAKDAVKIWRVD